MKPRTRSGERMQSREQRQEAPGFGVNESPVPQAEQTGTSHSRATRKRQAYSTLEIDRLMQYRLPGVGLDSSTRYPIPRCYPGTRRALLDRFSSGVRDRQRDRSVLWLRGPAGVGKSAIAQTLAEHCRDQIGRLGAALFFSRQNVHSNRIILELAYQLTIHCPSYKQLITRRLVDNPAVLEQEIVSQFRELIAQPFSSLKNMKGAEGKFPLLVVLDGLDEYGEETAQIQILELIIEYTRLTIDPPLIWMICSRPEMHLESVFSRAAYRSLCMIEQIVDRDNEDDILLYLQDGFRKIRQKHGRFFGASTEPWPPVSQAMMLSKAASGLFDFASILLRLVEGNGSSDPKVQLSSFLGFLEQDVNLPASEPSSSRSLDSLYSYILSTIPMEVLSDALQILGFCVHFPDHQLSILALSNFLNFESAAFHDALRPLEGLLVDIPGPPQAHSNRLQFYYKSFPEFLADPSRSGPFHVSRNSTYNIVVAHLLRWHIWSARYSCDQLRCEFWHSLFFFCSQRMGMLCIDGSCCKIEDPHKMLKWVPETPPCADEALEIIVDFASSNCWKVCGDVIDDGDSVALFRMILDVECCPQDHFVVFVKQFWNEVRLSLARQCYNL